MNAKGKEIAVLTLSSDGRLVATGSINHAVTVWSLHPVKQLLTIQPHVGTVYDIQFSFDGKVLAVGGAEGGGLWGLPDGGLLSRIKAPNVEVLRFSSDGSTLATASSSGGKRTDIRLWTLRVQKR